MCVREQNEMKEEENFDDEKEIDEREGDRHRNAKELRTTKCQLLSVLIYMCVCVSSKRLHVTLGVVRTYVYALRVYVKLKRANK